MGRSIGDWLVPSFFISYSRRQEEFAAALRARLSIKGARSVWFDRDKLQPGDIWREELRRGILAADELILLLSADSAVSRVVEEEVQIAVDGRKLVRPILIGPLTTGRPSYLGSIQELNLATTIEPEARINKVLEFLGDSVSPHARGDTLKLKGCRQVFPVFSEALIRPDGQKDVRRIAAELALLCPCYEKSSTIWLNAGLSACVVGDWDGGLKTLRQYAAAANSFPGWYFLAVHLARTESLSRVPRSIAEEAREAAERAVGLSNHPLAFLSIMLIETGGLNFGPHNLTRRVRQFASALAQTEIEKSEAQRAYWCLRASFPLLGSNQIPIRQYLREVAS